MEKRKIMECFETIKHDLRISRERLGHAEYFAQEMYQRLEKEDYIDDDRFSEVLGVFESLLIELKQMQKKRRDEIKQG